MRGDQLEEGKCYRLVEGCTSSSLYAGTVLYVQSICESLHEGYNGNIRICHAVPLYCPRDFYAASHNNWWLYQDDTYEEVSDEEATAARLAQ